MRIEDRRELAMKPTVTGCDPERGQVIILCGMAGLRDTVYVGCPDPIELPNLQEYITVVNELKRRQCAMDACERIKEELMSRAWHPSRLVQCLD